MRPRTFWSCVIIGCLVATAMILLHFGPGIHPKAPADTTAYRNSLRISYINQLADGLRAYYKSSGSWPITMPTQPTQICTTSGSDCMQKNLVDLSFLTTAGNYIIGIPHDPNGGRGQWGSGFYIQQLPNGNVLLTAPKAEAGRTISQTVST